MGELEWISRQSVKPIKALHYPCALDAMLENGVQVFFVGKDTFRAIRAAEDHGLIILRSLTSENQLRSINVLPLTNAQAGR